MYIYLCSILKITVKKLKQIGTEKEYQPIKINKCEEEIVDKKGITILEGEE